MAACSGAKPRSGRYHLADSHRPHHAIIVPVNANKSEQWEAAWKVNTNSWRTWELRVLIDDRDQRAGVKFKDADLIGHTPAHHHWSQGFAGKPGGIEEKDGKVKQSWLILTGWL